MPVIGRWVMICMLLSLTACKSFKDPKQGDQEWLPTYPESPAKGSIATNGSLYDSKTSMSLYETPRAKRIGDILTIVLIENTASQAKAENTSIKNEQSTITNPTLFNNPLGVGLSGQNYGLGFTTNGNRNFTGRADAKQNNTLTGNISVTVAKVLSNGNLIVKGEKWVRLNQGSNDYIRLSGIVRPQDIAPDNTVTSDKVANANITFSGTGQNNDTNKRGWLSKFLWGAFFPF